MSRFRWRSFCWLEGEMHRNNRTKHQQQTPRKSNCSQSYRDVEEGSVVSLVNLGGSEARKRSLTKGPRTQQQSRVVSVTNRADSVAQSNQWTVESLNDDVIAGYRLKRLVEGGSSKKFRWVVFKTVNKHKRVDASAGRRGEQTPKLYLVEGPRNAIGAIRC